MRLIWKILREHLSWGQLWGFLLSNMVGLTIILLGLQLYEDVMPLFQSQTDFLKPEYVVISKAVTTVDTFSGTTPTFSRDEQNDLAEQPFVTQWGVFRAAQYAVYGCVELGGHSLSSEMFFESVPDRFVDVESDLWHFTPGDDQVPIVIPRDYLSLYNFGYAQANAHMPALSEQILSSITLNLTLYGRGERCELTGRVVGLSNRLNTILVPESFIQWSNALLASDTTAWEPSRMILQLHNPADQRVADYMAHHDYVVANDRLDASKTTWFLHLLISIVMAIGLIICILSCYILLLSIFLLLQKNQKSMRNLMHLGYSHTQILRPYLWMVGVVNLLAWAVAALATYIVRGLYLPVLHQMASDYQPASCMLACGVTGGLIVITILFNIYILFRRVRQL